MVSPSACQAEYVSSILITRSSAVSMGLQTLINQKTHPQVIGKIYLQKFGRLVGVNLVIGAFATDPQEVH